MDGVRGGGWWMVSGGFVDGVSIGASGWCKWRG